MLRGDVETIVLKALEKEPPRRYQSAADLGRDIRRYLNSEPIEARPASFAYQFRIFARRNRALFVWMATAATALVVAVVVSSSLAVWAVSEAHQRKLAEEAANERAEEANAATEKWREEADLARKAEMAEARQSYLAKVVAAEFAFRTDDIPTALRRLEQADENSRAWEWYPFRALFDSSTKTVTAPEQFTSVAFSSQGRIASGFRRSVLHWDAASGETIEELVGHDDNIIAVAFSPNGRYLASGSWDMTIRLWNLETGGDPLVLEGHDDAVGSVAFSPDGRRLASGSFDGTARVWDLETGSVATLAGHEFDVLSVAFSPDGRMLASGSADATIKLWDVDEGHEVETLIVPKAPVVSLAYSADGRYLAWAARDEIVMWDRESREILAILRGHDEQVSSIAVSPDSRYLVSGSYDNTLRLWHVENAKERVLLDRSRPARSIFFRSAFHGHDEDVLSVAFSNDGREIVSRSWDGTIKRWDIGLDPVVTRVHGHAGRVQGLVFSRDGRYLASASRDGLIKIWDSRRLREVASLPGKDVSFLGFASNESRIVSGSIGQVATMVLGKEGRAVGARQSAFKIHDLTNGGEVMSLQGHVVSTSAFDLDPSGRWLASGYSRDAVNLWDLESAGKTHELTGHSKVVMSVDFSSDGRRLASGSWDHTVRIWDVARGELIKTLDANPPEEWQGVRQVEFAPGDERIAWVTGRTITVWDIERDVAVHRLHHGTTVFSIDFSPDGRWLISASRSGQTELRLWDLERGVVSHTVQVSSSLFVFSPDGKRLAVASGGNVILIDVETGEDVTTLTGPGAQIVSLTFSPDGRILAAGDSSGAIMFWRAPGLPLTAH